jgi:ATP-dependent DNA helicase RecG
MNPPAAPDPPGWLALPDPLAPEQVLAAVEVGAGPRTELEPESEYQTTLAESLVAFANAGEAATIVVGVQDRPATVRGVSDVPAAVSRLWSAARQVNPPLHDWLRVEPVRLGEKTVVAAHLRAAAPGVYHVGGRYLIRRGAQNLPLTQRELRRMLHERGIAAYEDNPVRGATLDDLDPARIAWYRARRAETRLSRLDDLPPTELLDKLGLRTSEGQPTVAAILFFGREPQRFFPHMVIRCAAFQSDWPGDFEDQTEIGGTVPELIEGAYAFVQRHSPHPARIAGITREERPAYPPVAVREAIANAVVHRDLSIKESVIRVFLYARHIEIDSPGGLLPGLTVENMARSTILRNKKLAELLYHTGYIERQGTGIRRMQRAMREAGLAEPRILDNGQSLFVELRLSAADETPVAPALPAAVAPTAASNEAPAPTAPTAPAPDLARDTIESLNIRQRRLLTLLRDRGGITRVEYESFFHVGTRTAKRDLKGLLDAGLIEHRGSSTASYYVLGRG